MSENQNNHGELYQYGNKVIKIAIRKKMKTELNIYLYVDESKLLEKDGKKCLPLIEIKKQNQVQEQKAIDCKCFFVKKEDDKYLLELKLDENIKDLAAALLVTKNVKAIFNEKLEIKDLELYG